MKSEVVRIERERGKPLADVLIELYEEHRNLESVARELEVSPSAVSHWIKQQQLVFVRNLERREQTA